MAETLNLKFADMPTAQQLEALDELEHDTRYSRSRKPLTDSVLELLEMVRFCIVRIDKLEKPTGSLESTQEAK